MNPEIELSIMANRADNLAPLLKQFEAQEHIAVRLRLLTWDTAWAELVKVALYGDGPDLSELGSTWLGDLVSMNALRPFSTEEIGALGGPAAFLPSAWQGGRLAGQSEQWAIPWLVGARLVYYRRNLLEAAGIDPGTAFDSAGAVDHTLARLQANGISVPWTVPTNVTHTTLLNACSWVWRAGGDFVSPDGRELRFDEPAANAGLRDYFALGRYLGSGVRRLGGLEPDNQFMRHADTAATISGPWLFCAARDEGRAEMLEHMGLALPCGLPFVGGSHLVVWRHTRRPAAALKLAQFLTGPAAQVAYSRRIGLLPARLEALQMEPFASDPLWRQSAAGLTAGRTFPVIRLWGLIEDRMSTAMGAVWADLNRDPEADLDESLKRHMEPVWYRLRLSWDQLDRPRGR